MGGGRARGTCGGSGGVSDTPPPMTQHSALRGGGTPEAPAAVKAKNTMLSSASYRGREFLAVFPQNDDESPSAHLQLLLTSYGPAETQVSVTLHGGSITQNVTLGPDVTVPLPLPANLELTGSCTCHKTLVVRASTDISVVAVSTKGYTVGATALLPMESLGTRYYVVTPLGNNTYGLTEFVVAAGAATTAVSITTTATFHYAGATYVPGAVLRLFLQPYHSLQLQSSQDFTGTVVVADTPVAVLSGHTCVKVSAGFDFVVEQLFPMTAWGRSYVVPPNPLQTDVDFVYVVTDEDNTITYNAGSGNATVAMAAGEVQTFVVNRNSHLYINAVLAVQVVFFFSGSSWQDPFLLVVPPVSAHCTAFRFSSVPSQYNHAVLIAPTTATATTTLNHRPDKTLAWQAIRGTDFSWASITVSAAMQSAENSQVPIGLLVFGFQSHTGYGFPGLCASTPIPLSCEDLVCEERCEMVDGQPECIQETFSTCWLAGGPHYRSFDGKTFDFMGTCTYTLTTICNPDPTLPAFSVEVKKEEKENSKVSSIGSITIRVDNVTVTAVQSENGMVRVNNHRSRLPISLSHGKLRIHQKGKSMLMQSHFNLKVLYNWDDHVVIKLPAALSGKVCGMCGNNNGDPRDDALSPDGKQVWDIVELGRSWKVTSESSHCQDSCDGDCGRCRWDQVVTYRAETWCGKLSQHSGPFQSCHDTVSPNIYMKNCIHDLCASEGRHDVLCHALQIYADDCLEEGISISDWRTTVGCPLTCPPNSTYSTCGLTCLPTCNIPAVSSSCAAATTCVDTCVCHEGLVLDGNTCIPPSECGCVFRGLFHGLGEEFWGDLTCTQRCVCDAEQRQAVCWDSGCGTKEECRVEEGIQGCYPKIFGVCTAVGATHYKSFDGKRFIFQGTCVYLLVGLCEDTPNLVGFQVLVQNGHRSDNLMSSIAMVTVKVYNKTISISREHPGKIMIDQQLVNLPYYYSERKIVVYRDGQDAVVETNFGLIVTYDWYSHVTATVPSGFANALCGLCGNYNGAASDDMRMRNNHVTSDPDAFGRSWKVTDAPGCSERSTVECSSTVAPSWLQQKVSGMGCEIILEADGPFRACHGHVDAHQYFQSCIHDSCLFPDQEEGMCPTIALYANTCQAAGVSIERWRRDNFCYIPCPSNSSYELCSHTCKRTCGADSAMCPGRCREGCTCQDGFMLSGDECVPTSHCGCSHHGVYYKEGETFYPTEQEMCQCLSGGTVKCQNTSCPAGGPGKVIDGVFQCPLQVSSTCVATGDRTYVTFDGMAFNITGTCSYILTQTCTGDNVTSFIVTIQKEARQKGKVSGIQALSVAVYGVTLTLKQGKGADVMVDSISHHLPTTLSEGQVQVYVHGTGVLLRTDFGLVVHYDLVQHVMVTVPQTYMGHLCGLCGNYNGQRNDDFQLSSGQLAPDATAFGSAWKTMDTPCNDSCPKDECPTCTEEKVAVLQKPNYCGLLTAPEGPFGSCHRMIDPIPYSQSCIHDLCMTGGDTRVLCQNIQSYVTMCQDAGVTVGAWRTPSFCHPCKSLQCRPKERCRPRGAQSRCVPALVATCWAWGDPHFRTFDGLDFDFQGTCTYTMAESHGNDPGLVPFRVEAKNDIRGGIQSMSYVSLVNVDVYGQRISFRQNEDGKVRVNGEVTLLPVLLADGKVRVRPSGLRVALETDFGLRVSYDWNWHLLIDLPSSYFRHVRGLCGNFNLKPLDDIPEAGDNTTAIVTWAKSWKSADSEANDPICWDYCDGACPVCDEEKKELYGGSHYCGIIKKSFQGPFRACHNIVKPHDFYRNCLLDLCLSNGARSILCQVLETYAATCRKHGAMVHDWRTPSGCPLPCPENSHYEPCGSACPATCSDWDNPAICDQPCVETCACNTGHVLSGGQCVPVSHCGCTRDGRYYRPGEEFWGDNTCRSRCRCDMELGMVVCEDSGCKPGEVCTVVKGVRRCVANSRSICVATGDPHYTTFDGRRYDFMGTCVYLLAGLCSTDSTLIPFAVTVENNHRGSHLVSFTKVVTMEVYNMTLSLSQEHPRKVKVNGVLLDLPFTHNQQLQVSLRGVHGFITTDAGVTVTFDWYSYARVIIPNTYAGAVCGLCGNANGDPRDDFVTRDGRSADNETHLGDSWKVGEVPGCSAGCSEGCQVCSDAQKRAYRGDKHCGLLGKKRGPFAACHDIIDPAPYLDDCLFDACLYEGHQDTVCQAIAAYVAACQSQGAAVRPWRTPAFCSMGRLGGLGRVRGFWRAERDTELERGEPEEELEPVTVAVEQEDMQVQRVTVTAHGVTVVMDRGQQWEVTVDGERHLLPLWLRGDAVGVAQVGSHRLLQVQGGPKILYDGNAYVVLTLPPPSRRPRGLCGNFNGDPNDDDDPAGEALGSSPPNCTRLAPAPSCSPAQARRCAVLADPEGPFAGCHGAVPPRTYLLTCERQVCGAGGDPCPGFQGYAAACQAAGGALREWREAAGCPLTCPPKSHYQLCARTCEHTCAGVSAPPPCSERCFEGCQCAQGLLFDGARCVLPGTCGCLHQGRYFQATFPHFPHFIHGKQIAETILTADCSQSCTCRGPGGLQCRPFTCPFSHTCGLRDGTRTCIAHPGRCALSPATRFVTFDGVTGATLAPGIYVVASVCDPRDPAWFRLLGDIRDIGDQPAVVALHLFTPHSLITVRRNRKVWLNGVPTPPPLPLELPGPLTIMETQATLRISRTPGFLVELGARGVTVEVPREARATLCGLCGDYDSATSNDLRGPDGTATSDARALAEAWRAPDFTQRSKLCQPMIGGHAKDRGSELEMQKEEQFWGLVHGIWPRLKRDQRRDGRSLFGPPGQLAKREQPGTGNEEERWRVSIPAAGKGDVRVGV
ncbi:hypothetical protein DUI87_13672 [Hirundo rustica rustica]|uniref:VWFD domain-containing protein n=1 Tax=Hirundo rustica rustica TaxID=333673 RepID=A0A3M0KEK6_HIRRU|nr:hypothetical protein DUI87_13672 [Hirundo rustica rustica]